MADPKRIYVMSSARKGVKIGMSHSPSHRALELEADGAGKMTIHYETTIRDDAFIIETVAHDVLATKRKVGEWFHAEVEEAIAAVQKAVELAESGGIATWMVENAAFRKRLQRKRERDSGLIHMQITIPAEKAEEIKAIVAKIRAEFDSKQRKRMNTYDLFDEHMAEAEKQPSNLRLPL